MLLLGDICIAEADRICLDSRLIEIFKSNISACNLEGPINLKKSFNVKNLKMHNSSEIIDYFDVLNVKIVGIANNHIFDWGNKSVLSTISFLEEKGIKSVGYRFRGKSKIDSVKIIEDNKIYSFYAFGWPIISCKKPSLISPGINPLDEVNINYYIENILPNISNNVIKVVYMHWCYEMEPYIQPLHRDFAKKLIDAGVQIIVGSHPHVPGPIEKYKGGFIFHTLGNFLYSSEKFCNGKLKFPKVSNSELMIEINGLRDIKVHKLELKDNYLKLVSTYQIPENIKKFTKYPITLSSRGYDKWYRAWSEKRSRFLPVFSTESNFLKKKFFNFMIFLRMFLIKTMILFKIKNPAKRRSLKN